MSESKYNCDFIDVISDDMCETELAGNGDQIYYCERKLVKNLPIDQAGNLNADDFVTAVKGKLHQLDMHSDTVEGTGTVEDDQTAGQSQLTGRCDKGEDKFRVFDRIARYKDIAYFAVSTTGKIRGYYSQNKKCRYSSSYTTGTEYNSDHGFTMTVTVPATEFAYIGIDLNTQTADEKATIDDLLQKNSASS